MTYDPNTLAYLIGLQLSRFPSSCDHWEVYDPRWPGEIAIRLESLGQYYVPVDGERFLAWLSTTLDLKIEQAETFFVERSTKIDD